MIITTPMMLFYKVYKHLQRRKELNVIDSFDDKILLFERHELWEMAHLSLIVALCDKTIDPEILFKLSFRVNKTKRFKI